MKKTIYITTSIPYVNGAPHIGFTLEVVQADAYARWHRLLEDDVYFLAGTDENAMKNVEAAEKQRITPKELVDTLSQKFLALKDAYNLTYNQFIRTTDKKHQAGAQVLWQSCKKDIYKKDYTGLYCVGCETFYKDGEFPGNICPEHDRPLEKVTESNYFFRLTAYKKEIKKLIETDTLKIYPEFRKAELINMLDSDLEDFSISRPVERVKGWGIPVPEDSTQIMYVWFDALTNYITALDFAENGDLYKKYWLENENKYHAVGKNVIKFHAIYWIGMLLSAGLPLPKRIYAHGFINADGKKMSKSLGNVIDPFQEVTKYGVDAVRYYLLREIPSLDDGDYTHSRMKEIYSSELANELGNLASRITTIAEKDGIHFSPKPIHLHDSKYSVIHSYYEDYSFNKVAEHIWKEVKLLNKSINEFEPWKKASEERQGFLLDALQSIYEAAILLQPIMPSTSEKLVKAAQGAVKKIEPLFPRLVESK